MSRERKTARTKEKQEQNHGRDTETVEHTRERKNGQATSRN